MTNKALSVLILIPMWTLVFMGMIGSSDGTLEILGGFMMVVFGTWGAVRLYKGADNQ